MSAGNEISELFSASARPTPSEEETAEKLRKMQAEHTNSLRPAPGDTPKQLGEKLCTLACIYEPEPVHAAIAQELLDLGADVRHWSDSGTTALMSAFWKLMS